MKPAERARAILGNGAALHSDSAWLIYTRRGEDVG